MASEREGKMACTKVVSQKAATSSKEVAQVVSQKTSVTQRRNWFTYVNQKLEEPSVMRKGDQVKVS
jgi:hypothetical protein